MVDKESVEDFETEDTEEMESDTVSEEEVIEEIESPGETIEDAEVTEDNNETVVKEIVDRGDGTVSIKAPSSPEVIVSKRRPITSEQDLQIGTICTECGMWYPVRGKVYCPACKGKTVDGPKHLAGQTASGNKKARGIQ